MTCKLLTDHELATYSYQLVSAPGIVTLRNERDRVNFSRKSSTLPF